VADPPVVVAFTTWNRPHYLERVLDAWSRVRGIGSASLLFSCEPGCREVTEMCEAVTFADWTVTVNECQTGAMLNTRRALDAAFRLSDYAILATDDFLPSTDMLELHAWHRDNYRDDPSVLALVCGRGDAADGGPAAVWRSQVMGWLPGFHAAKWAVLSERWEESARVPGGWYPWIDSRFLLTGEYDVLLPALSRAQDIGEAGGTGAAPSRCFSEHYPPQEYFEVTGKREHGLDFRVEECP